MNYANIKYRDIADGEGVRTTLFVSGCSHHCENCFQPETWSFSYGQEFTTDIADEVLATLDDFFVDGLTFLGGEPMEPQNRATVLSLVKIVREIYPRKTIWCYTGYDFDKDLLAWMEAGDPVITKLLPLLDVIVDGEYKEECRNLRLPFRGSENQRILDVPLSLKEKCGIILHT